MEPDCKYAILSDIKRLVDFCSDCGQPLESKKEKEEGICTICALVRFDGQLDDREREN